jgi:hypothetical protein
MNINNAPTAAQLRELLQSCNDAHGTYAVWVDHQGEVQITLLLNEIPAQEMGEKVEVNSINDTLYVTSLFKRLVKDGQN